MYNNPFQYPYGDQVTGIPNVGYNFNQTQQVPIQGTQSQIIRVHGEEGAKAFALQPNSSVLLMDETDAVIWAKVTDGAGYATLKGFNIIPIEKKVANNALDEYVKRKDFDDLKDRFEKLMKELGNDKSNS